MTKTRERFSGACVCSRMSDGLFACSCFFMAVDVVVCDIVSNFEIMVTKPSERFSNVCVFHECLMICVFVIVMTVHVVFCDLVANVGIMVAKTSEQFTKCCVFA